MGLEEDLADILAQCLERDPEKRPSAEDVLKFLGGEQDDGRLLYEWFRSELGIYEDTLKRLRDQH
jgi:serine/threonine protein kinase